MALYLIATPIGNPGDISLRALDTLKKVNIVIGEELKVTRRFLADNQTGRKDLYKLNEHSTDEEVEYLCKLCEKNDVALISDCGTPGFCDPGSRLVRALRKKQVPIHSLPGASSLMYLLSLSSQRIDSFYFAGFLPAKSEERAKAWKKINNFDDPIFLLETPYRFGKLIAELKQKLTNRRVLIGANLSSAEEILWEGKCSSLSEKNFPKKAEPVILIYP
jgi:16S rRNA (cytidine1402-2'-O)-methyltransferase